MSKVVMKAPDDNMLFHVHFRIFLFEGLTKGSLYKGEGADTVSYKSRRFHINLPAFSCKSKKQSWIGIYLKY